MDRGQLPRTLVSVVVLLSGHAEAAEVHVRAPRAARPPGGRRRGSESAVRNQQELPEEEAFDINERAGACARSAADSLHQ